MIEYFRSKPHTIIFLAGHTSLQRVFFGSPSSANFASDFAKLQGGAMDGGAPMRQDGAFGSETQSFAKAEA